MSARPAGLSELSNKIRITELPKFYVSLYKLAQNFGSFGRFASKSQQKIINKLQFPDVYN